MELANDNIEAVVANATRNARAPLLELSCQILREKNEVEAKLLHAVTRLAIARRVGALLVEGVL